MLFCFAKNVPSKNQNTVEEVNRKYCDENGIKILRRSSGGGTVYHDLNNVNYTIIVNNENTASLDFKSFSKPIIKSLEEMGVTATINKKNDLLIGDKKICGHAQHIKGKRVMHHGCMLFDVDLKALSESLKVRNDENNKIESNSRKSVRSQVINIKDHLQDKSLTAKDFCKILKAQMNKEHNMKDYELSKAEIAEVKKIQASHNDSWDWIFGRNPDFTIERKRKLPAGNITTKIFVSENLIKQINFNCDCCDEKKLQPLAEKLIDTKYEYKSIKAVLEKEKLEECFLDIELNDLLDVLLDVLVD